MSLKQVYRTCSFCDADCGIDVTVDEWSGTPVFNGVLVEISAVD